MSHSLRKLYLRLFAWLPVCLIGVGFVYDIDVGVVRVLGSVLVGAFVSGYCYLLV